MKRLFGFTLAEVLITLGIIGVVAAMTIPSLMANYQKQVWINKLKKTYSVLNEGYRQIMVNEGCTDIECAVGVLDLSNDEVKNKFVNTFKLSNVILDYEIKKVTDLCGTRTTFSECASSGSIGSPTLSGTSADGSIILFATNPIVGFVVFVDTNGLKGPNEGGRDIFLFTATDKIFTTFYSMPYCKWYEEETSIQVCGTEDERKQFCSGDSSATCATRIINDGWQMNY